ncbi:GNAT family N-acetyltransferase [Bacillus sp. FJAT-27264]|uniref:GNAT family N-acetyltransferase n=1 Tax=Paenibacillus sp. (strain DSM 101736 / FJAT-27264) TaxID=1850362 RepID=UPI0009F6B137|nr:GNAT family N-acetyltransferase [Bacillus sp. FJAT-27264]
MVQLLPVLEDKQKVLYNLHQLYHHDFSPFTGEEINQDTDPDPTHLIYDFMILRKFRRQGLGRAAAELAFDSFKANWKVAQMSSNEAAILFWREVIGEYTDQSYTKSFKSDVNKYIQAFSTK